MRRGMGRRNHHKWDISHPEPDVNMRCSACGMDQKPEVKGSYRFYYRRPGEEWQLSKYVPYCCPPGLRIEATT